MVIFTDFSSPAKEHPPVAAIVSEINFANVAPSWSVSEQTRKQVWATLRTQLDRNAIVILRNLPISDRASGERLLRQLASLLGPILPDVDGSQIQQLVVQDPFGPRTTTGLLANRPYREMPLHTDGAFCEQTPEWVGLLKTDESFANGGDSIFLSLDQWEELDLFSRHPLATREIPWTIPGAANATPYWAPVFQPSPHGLAIRFSEHCLADGALNSISGLSQFITELAQSLNHSPGQVRFRLHPRDAYFVNNRRALHGRCRFEPHRQLFRQVLRVRGVFSSSPAPIQESPRESLP